MCQSKQEANQAKSDRRKSRANKKKGNMGQQESKVREFSDKNNDVNETEEKDMTRSSINKHFSPRSEEFDESLPGQNMSDERFFSVQEADERFFTVQSPTMSDREQSDENALDKMFSARNTSSDNQQGRHTANEHETSISKSNCWVSEEAEVAPAAPAEEINVKRKKKRKVKDKVAQFLSSRANKTKVVPSAGEASEDTLTDGTASSSSLEKEVATSDHPNECVPVPCMHSQCEDGFISVSNFFNKLNDGQLSPYLYDPTFMLIIDTRPQEDYEKLHIITAVHYSTVETSPFIEPLENYTFIILYDETGRSHSLTDSVLSLALDRIVKKVNDPLILEGGYKAVHDRHPYLCTERTVTTQSERQALLTIYPSTVLDDQLYLGRGEQATSKKIVEDLEISHIVNISCEHQNVFQDTIKYLRIALDDVNTSNLLQHFPEAIHFIDNAIKKNGKVLVHCNLGVSRSATVVIAYLMHTRHWIVKDAYEFIKECRPIISPNRGFFNQLSKFEEKLFGRKLTDVDALWM